VERCVAVFFIFGVLRRMLFFFFGVLVGPGEVVWKALFVDYSDE